MPARCSSNSPRCGERTGFSRIHNPSSPLRSSNRYTRIATLLSMPVADESLVAHQKVGEVAVMRYAGTHVMGWVMAAVQIGHGGFGQQSVDEVLIGGDGVEHQRTSQRRNAILA